MMPSVALITAIAFFIFVATASAEPAHTTCAHSVLTAGASGFEFVPWFVVVGICTRAASGARGFALNSHAALLFNLTAMADTAAQLNPGQPCRVIVDLRFVYASEWSELTLTGSNGRCSLAIRLQDASFSNSLLAFADLMP